MVGCCGFLSFSLVFCLLGSRLGTTLYIHFTRRWVKSTRHSSASREKKNEEKGGKECHSSLGGFVGRGWVCRLWWSVFRGAGSVASLGFLGCGVWLGMSLRIGGGLRFVCRYGGWAGAEVRWLCIGRGRPRGGGGVSRPPPGVRRNRSTLLLALGDCVYLLVHVRGVRVVLWCLK